MMLDRTRAIGRAMLGLLGLGRFVPAALIAVGAVMAGTGLIRLFSGDLSAAVWFALGAILILAVQSGVRGDWRWFIPHSALVVVAASLSQWIAQPASRSGPVETARLENSAPEPVEAAPAAQTDDTEPDLQPEPDSDEPAPEDEAPRGSFFDLGLGRADVSNESAEEDTDPVAAVADDTAEEAETAPLIDLDPAGDEPAFDPGVAVVTATDPWDQINAGRDQDGTEPEQSGIKRLIGAGESFVGRDLSFLDLSGLDFSPDDAQGRDLSAAQLYGSRFACTDLEDAQLVGAVLTFPPSVKPDWHRDERYTDARFGNFRRADLDGSLAGGTDFRFANFENADFGTADIRAVVLDYANLAGANLRYVSGLQPDDLRHACVNADTILPASWAPGAESPVREAWSEQCDAYWGPRERTEAPSASGFARYEVRPVEAGESSTPRYRCG